MGGTVWLEVFSGKLHMGPIKGGGGGPPAEVELIFYEQFLTSDGLPAGPKSLVVNGSVTPVLFRAPALAQDDVFVHELVFVLEDEKLLFEKFGNIGPLTNGVNIQIRQEGVVRDILINAKTLFELSKLSADRFEAYGRSSGGNEGINIRIELDKTKLAGGSTDEIQVTVRDDLTALSVFNAQLVGGKR